MFPFFYVFVMVNSLIPSAPSTHAVQSSGEVFAAASASAIASASAAAVSAGSSSESASGMPSPFLPASKKLRGGEKRRKGR